ncbi:MAG: hypothetical protein AAGF24_05085 [Cyanobacteria bacterium P01_H01_bin.121]
MSLVTEGLATDQLTQADAEQIALEFLTDEWQLSAEDAEWFSILSCRWIGECWYVAEVGIEGLPDKWVFQIFDTGYCDPNYTFASPIKDGSTDDLPGFPDRLAEIVAEERKTVMQ